MWKQIGKAFPGGVNFDQTGRSGKGAEYERARRLLTSEVNTVVAACKEAGVEKIIVNDGHAGGYNFICPPSGQKYHRLCRYVPKNLQIQVI